jgi:tryptophan synthase alpha chain
MNRINQLFQDKKTPILSIYFTAGYPDLNTASTIITDLEKNGVDMIEIGIPFSDPLADGQVIQQSSQKALKNGMTLKKLFGELKNIRESVTMPLLLMGYFNTVLRYGVEQFCQDAQAIGIDGVILPDMPLDVYEESYQDLFEKYEIIPVFLITPGTSEERIKKTDALSKGFIYMVSSASTTGTKEGFGEENLGYFKRIKDMNLTTPVVAGFGISNKTTFSQASQYSKGGIVGSAFIKSLNENGTDFSFIADFVKGIRG